MLLRWSLVLVIWVLTGVSLPAQVLNNWTNLASGRSHQIYFGTSGSGLTPGKLSQVRFLDPAGSPPGYYDARILSNGEVVPIAPPPAPTLQAVRSGNQLVITWTGNFQLFSATNVLGPFQPVSGAISPYTNDTGTVPERFFMLKGP